MEARKRVSPVKNPVYSGEPKGDKLMIEGPLASDNDALLGLEVCQLAPITVACISAFSRVYGNILFPEIIFILFGDKGPYTYL